MPSGFIPAEYPKTLYSPEGKTASARNPDHLAELAEKGWSEEYVAPPVPAPVAAQPAGATAAQTELTAAKATISQLTKELMAATVKHDSLNALWVAATSELESLKEKFKAGLAAPDAPDVPDQPTPKLKVPLAPAAPITKK